MIVVGGISDLSRVLSEKLNCKISETLINNLLKSGKPYNPKNGVKKNIHGLKIEKIGDCIEWKKE